MINYTKVMQRAGILNTDSLDLSDMVTSYKDRMATYCQSFSCAGNSTKKDGTLVGVNYGGLNVCPYCQSTKYLTSRIVTSKTAERLERELNEEDQLRKLREQSAKQIQRLRSASYA